MNLSFDDAGGTVPGVIDRLNARVRQVQIFVADDGRVARHLRRGDRAANARGLGAYTQALARRLAPL